MIGKDDAGANRQYGLWFSNLNLAYMLVWPGPVGILSAATIVTGWNHVIGMYDPTNLDLHVVLNGVVTTVAGLAPAALADTGAPFTIGANGAGGSIFTGYASDCVLCASFLGTNFARALFHHTKAAYGVK